jgi:hypothetical protein
MTTTFEPTFPSVTSTSTFASTARASRHDFPARDGSAIETSEPLAVAIVVTGPFGSGPTGGAVARTGTTRTSAAASAARTAMRCIVGTP